MCLLSYSKCPKTAKERITIYKVVQVFKNEYMGPFYGGIYKDFPILKGGCSSLIVKNTIGGQYEYGKGYIHAYSTYNKALELYSDLKISNPSIEYKIFKGYIPNHVAYVLDTDANCICAKKIILESEINE